MQEKSDFEIENPNILKNIRHQNAEVGFSGAKVGLQKRNWTSDFQKKSDYQQQKTLRGKKSDFHFPKENVRF